MKCGDEMVYDGSMENKIIKINESRDLILTPKQLIMELRKPGKAYAFCRWTQDDETVVEIVKSYLVAKLQEYSEEMKIACLQNSTGIYIGW